MEWFSRSNVPLSCTPLGIVFALYSHLSNHTLHLPGSTVIMSVSSDGSRIGSRKEDELLRKLHAISWRISTSTRDQ